jgi:hypothetical protein
VEIPTAVPMDEEDYVMRDIGKRLQLRRASALCSYQTKSDKYRLPLILNTNTKTLRELSINSDLENDNIKLNLRGKKISSHSINGP